MATYKIPPAMAGNGKGWGGVAPKKTPKKVHRTTAKSAASKLGY